MVRFRTALCVLDKVSKLKQGPTSVRGIQKLAVPLKAEELLEFSPIKYVAIFDWLDINMRK